MRTDPAEDTTIRVVVVDDEAMVRAGLRMLLDHQRDLEVVGEAADGIEARSVVRQTDPDVVLMDVRMPRSDGIEAARHIIAEHRAKVIVLTTFDEDAAVAEALRVGVSGFLLKVAPPEQLVQAVRVVAGGQALLDPAVTVRVIEAFASAPTPNQRAARQLGTLTEREVDVLRLAARGLSNAEIAAELYLGEATVKTYLSRMLAKLDLRDRVQAVAFAYESGLIRPGANQ